MWSRILITALTTALLVPLGASAEAHTGRAPDRIALPAGFQPEGIATGPGPVAFFGSRATGAIYRADLRTGRGKVISPGPGTPSLGMKTRGSRLSVAGGSGGDARVVDTRTGAVPRSYTLTGKLFRVDSRTGVAEEVDLHGKSLVNGDGLLLEGRTLYAVQNRLNTVAVLRLNKSATEGRVVKRLTDRRFDIPTTIARSGSRLYVPNARFSTPPTPETAYDAVAIRP